METAPPLPKSNAPVPISLSAGLSKLSPTVYFLQPSTSPSTPSPSTILLFAWMGAPLRHMTKFVDYYATQFPDTPIVLVLSPTNKFMAAEKDRQRDMQPAVTAFKSLNIASENVLVHTFSNGGVSALRTFLSFFPDEQEFTPRLLVVDSAPGMSTLSTAVMAFTAEVKNPVMKFLLSIILGTIYFALTAKNWVLGREPMLYELRRWLGNEHVIGKETKRVVLYSDNDQLVQKESVEWHVSELKRKGIPVSSINFGETGHVGHMRAYPELYWGEILRVWKE